jgi:hypothetical protein
VTDGILSAKMDFDDADIDPALAAAMGFSSFGAAPNKRRKVANDGDGYIDPDISKSASTSSKPPGTGANSVMPGARRPAPVKQVPTNTMPRPVPAALLGAEAGGAQTHVSQTHVSQASTNAVATGSTGSDSPSLEALRHGVRNAQGDMVFFKHSFLEDPWKDLRESRKA